MNWINPNGSAPSPDKQEVMRRFSNSLVGKGAVRIDNSWRFEKAEEIDDVSGFETDDDLRSKWFLGIRLLEQLELEYNKDFDVTSE